MSTINTLSSPGIYRPKTYAHSRTSHPTSLLYRKHSKHICFSRNFPRRAHFCPPKLFTILCISHSHNASKPAATPEPAGEDFVTRVLKENPSQVETKFLIGGKLYTLKEKEKLSANRDAGALEFLSKRLNLSQESSEGHSESKSGMKSGSVYLKDLLRQYRGKLYVPGQVFGAKLSEEDAFDKNVEEFPLISFEDFRKALQNDKVKLVTSKETFGGNLKRDFIVNMEEIPGDKNLQRTKWVMRLNTNEVETLMEEYTGPLYEIERHTRSWVAKLPEHPNPVASSISSRIVVELGMVTAIMGAAAVVVGGFLASAVFAVTSFVFATTVYVAWPVARAFLKTFLGLTLSIFGNVWGYLTDVFADGRIFMTLYEFSGLGLLAASTDVLKPILFVLLFMGLVLRFTLSRRPRNFRKWDIWIGIQFSQSKAEARVDGSTGVKFCDVAGIDEAVDELQELVRYLKNPELFDKTGVKAPHGVLLEGPPGCGKTLVAKAIAGEAEVPFYQMAGSEFVEVLVGVGSARIRDLFKRAQVNKPSVVFIDEIDAVGTRRQGVYKESEKPMYNAATQERETTLNQLLIELDGFDTGKGVIFLAATNRRDLLDPALLRPGRFDRKIKVLPPNAKGRADILKIHARKVKMSESVDLVTCATNLTGWTGAKLARLVQEAALVAVRNKHESILQSDMDMAVDRLTVGPQLTGIKLSPQGQSRRATVELGVAITSHLLRRYENAEVEYCNRVSIIPRGQTLSQVVFNRLDDESYLFERRPQLLHRLQILLGGRAAEEVIFGRDTSQASVDYLADASWLARKILTIWNLENPMVIHGEQLAWRKPLQFVGPRMDFEESLYNDHGLSQSPLNLNLDDEVAQRTERLIRNLYGKTISLLRRHNAALLKAVKVLLNKQEIRGEEIDFILDNFPAQTPLSRVLQEENPGSIPYFNQEQEPELEINYALPTQS